METPRYSKLAAMVIASLSATAALAAPQTDAQDTMVVTASGFQQKIQDSAASISVIPRQQIEDKAYRDVTDALKDVPLAQRAAATRLLLNEGLTMLARSR